MIKTAKPAEKQSLFEIISVHTLEAESNPAHFSKEFFALKM